MVTGDNLITANAIARECKIITGDISQNKEYMIMEGPAFYKLVGGLICITCGLDSQKCYCKPDKVNERVKNTEVFAKI